MNQHRLPKKPTVRNTHFNKITDRRIFCVLWKLLVRIHRSKEGFIFAVSGFKIVWKDDREKFGKDHLKAGEIRARPLCVLVCTDREPGNG